MRAGGDPATSGRRRSFQVGAIKHVFDACGDSDISWSRNPEVMKRSSDAALAFAYPATGVFSPLGQQRAVAFVAAGNQTAAKCSGTQVEMKSRRRYSLARREDLAE